MANKVRAEQPAGLLKFRFRGDPQTKTSFAYFVQEAQFSKELEPLLTGLHKTKLEEVVVLLVPYSEAAMQGNQILILFLCLTWSPMPQLL